MTLLAGALVHITGRGYAYVMCQWYHCCDELSRTVTPVRDDEAVTCLACLTLNVHIYGDGGDRYYWRLRGR
jgi:hypothetical protein